MDAMIVSRKIPKNKTQPNISKLLKIVKTSFILSFPQKQPCSNTMLKINNRSIKKKNDKNNDLQRALHRTLKSHKCCYKPAIHHQALAIS